MIATPISPARARKIDQVRRWIYVYFFLLIFEGVLRKWLSLGFLVSSLLLLVRDPVVLWIYYLAMRASVFRRGSKFMRVWRVTLIVMCILGVLQTFLNLWLSIWVAGFGVRCYCLHIPLIFVMARVLRREDLWRIGRWILILAGPMAALMVAQFLAPPNSFLNRATLGEGSEQIGAALGRIRPAGTFSFGTGATTFNLVVAAFLIYAVASPGWVSNRVKWVAAIALVAVLPVSGSRTFVLSCALVMLFALMAGTANRRLLRVMVGFIAAGAVMFMLLTFTSFFRDALLSFTTRWQQASDAYAGGLYESLVQRILGEYIHAFEDLSQAPFLGYGLGLASNVGAALTTRTLGFLLAESEWEKTVMEMGPLVAIYWLGLRTTFGVTLYRRAWKWAARGETLPWLLLGTECLAIFNGILEQATNLGFLVFTTGLCMAAIEVAESEAAEASAARKAFRESEQFEPEPAV